MAKQDAEEPRWTAANGGGGVPFAVPVARRQRPQPLQRLLRRLDGRGVGGHGVAALLAPPMLIGLDRVKLVGFDGWVGKWVGRSMRSNEKRGGGISAAATTMRRGGEAAG